MESELGRVVPESLSAGSHKWGKVIAYIRSCVSCPMREVCETLPDHRLDYEATMKVIYSYLAYELGAEVYEDYESFVGRLRDLLGFSVEFFIVDFTDEKTPDGDTVRTFKWSLFELSPILVLIDEIENRVLILNYQGILNELDGVKKLFNALMERFRKGGAREALSMPYEELVKEFELR